MYLCDDWSGARWWWRRGDQSSFRPRADFEYDLCRRNGRKHLDLACGACYDKSFGSVSIRYTASDYIHVEEQYSRPGRDWPDDAFSAMAEGAARYFVTRLGGAEVVAGSPASRCAVLREGACHAVDAASVGRQVAAAVSCGGRGEWWRRWRWRRLWRVGGGRCCRCLR